MPQSGTSDVLQSSIADAQVRASLEEVGMWEWCAGLPQGLDTVLEAGGSLSAGEAQLLSLARLFLKIRT